MKYVTTEDEGKENDKKTPNDYQEIDCRITTVCSLGMKP
jgi:hypothetical protein